jgi:hypothetical protein
MTYRLSLFSLFVWLGLACGGAPNRQQPPSGGPQFAGHGRCGVQVFRDPVCQQKLDERCCVYEIECAKDPACVQLMACIDREHDGDSNRCILPSRTAYCQNVCRGQANDCMTRCQVSGGPTEPAVKWGLIAQCSKHQVDYPPGLDCRQ